MASEAKHTPLTHREAVARLINPEAFRILSDPLLGETATTAAFLTQQAKFRVAEAFETADAILSLSQSREELMRKALEEVRNLDRARVRKALAPGEEPNPAAVALAKAGKIASEALSTITAAEGVKKP